MLISFWKLRAKNDHLLSTALGSLSSNGNGQQSFWVFHWNLCKTSSMLRRWFRSFVCSAPSIGCPFVTDLELPTMNWTEDQVTVISWLWALDAIGCENWPLLNFVWHCFKKKQKKELWNIFNSSDYSLKVFNHFLANKVLRTYDWIYFLRNFANYEGI